MLRVYHSNRLDVLSSLAVYLMKNPVLDPFQPEIILVQSQGMAQWLQIQWAQESGIAANIHFLKPASFIWKLCSQFFPELPEEQVFSKERLCWTLRRLLPALVKRDIFQPLADYLGGDEEGEYRQRKYFQLAARIADLFDQYLVYRPEWIELWQKGQFALGLGEEQAWQAALWVELVNDIQGPQQSKWHRATLFTYFIRALESISERPCGLPARVFICGISAIPPIYLRMLQALGKHIDVHILLTNPCRHYWGDKDELRSGNPLLASWGKVGRDNVWFLAQMEETQDIDAFVDISAHTVLKAVQHDVLELENRAIVGLTSEEFLSSQGKRRLDPRDMSISIHLCHSPLREIEILQDQILAMFEKDSSLTPRDIIVMVSDIEAYAPYIQAVFGSAAPERYLPFVVSDRCFRSSSLPVNSFSGDGKAIIKTVIELLCLPESRLLAEDVFNLLEIPALASRFNLDGEGIAHLRLWVREAGIRWGLDDAHVQNLKLPSTGQNTWNFGLKRMLLGYAMKTTQGEWNNILPYDRCHGLIAELVGHLATLLEQLRYWREKFSQPHFLEEWQALFSELIKAFFVLGTEADTELSMLETQWQDIVKCGIESGYRQQVFVTALRDELLSKLEQMRSNPRFFTGSINFCTLMPMRSVPFRIICLLGMNDGVYPRTLSTLSFDLMRQHPQKGDRSRRDDDRYLFLEVLLSAQERLYISYIARSIQDNTERNPSVLVSELTDYITQSFCLPGDEEKDADSSARNVLAHLTSLHTRTPFDAKNFSSEKDYPSFAQEWLPVARGEGVPYPKFIQKPLSPIALEELSFIRLQRFWRHPVRAFFNFRLGVYFTQEEENLPDTETFIPDGLTHYQLKLKLLNAMIEERDTQKLFFECQRTGILPCGAFAELFWKKEEKDLVTLAKQVRECWSDGYDQTIDMEIGALKLTGVLPQVHSGGLLRWRPREVRFIDGLMLWLEHLVWCAMGGQGVSRLLGQTDTQWCFDALPPENARASLQTYIEGFQEGLCRPLLSLPEAGSAWLRVCYDARNDIIQQDKATQKKARVKLMEAWKGPSFSLNQSPQKSREGEENDPYLQRLFRVLEDEQVTEICSTAEKWFLPVFRSNIERSKADSSG